MSKINDRTVIYESVSSGDTIAFISSIISGSISREIEPMTVRQVVKWRGKKMLVSSGSKQPTVYVRAPSVGKSTTDAMKAVMASYTAAESGDDA